MYERIFQANDGADDVAFSLVDAKLTRNYLNTDSSVIYITATRLTANGTRVAFGGFDWGETH